MGASGKFASLLILFVLLILWNIPNSSSFPTSLSNSETKTKVLADVPQIFSNQRVFTPQEQADFFSQKTVVQSKSVSPKTKPEPFSPLIDNYKTTDSHHFSFEHLEEVEDVEVDDSEENDTEGEDTNTTPNDPESVPEESRGQFDYAEATKRILRSQSPSNRHTHRNPPHKHEIETNDSKIDYLLDFDSEQYIETNPFKFQKLVVPHEKHYHDPLFKKFQNSQNMWTS